MLSRTSVAQNRKVMKIKRPLTVTSEAQAAYRNEEGNLFPPTSPNRCCPSQRYCNKPERGWLRNHGPLDCDVQVAAFVESRAAGAETAESSVGERRILCRLVGLAEVNELIVKALLDGARRHADRPVGTREKQPVAKWIIHRIAIGGVGSIQRRINRKVKGRVGRKNGVW